VSRAAKPYEWRPNTQWGKRVAAIMSDRQPHSYDELAGAVAALIPDGHAYRRGETSRRAGLTARLAKGEPVQQAETLQRTRGGREDSILSGKRLIAIDVIRTARKGGHVTSWVDANGLSWARLNDGHHPHPTVFQAGRLAHDEPELREVAVDPPIESMTADDVRVMNNGALERAIQNAAAWKRRALEAERENNKIKRTLARLIQKEK
jgi:hypothetical protein